MQLMEMTWQEVEHYLSSRKAIILPFGSIEQHGPSLPLGTDSYIAEKIAKEVGKKTFTIVTPCIRPGLSLLPHMAFPGTISLRPETVQKVTEDIINSLYRHGFRQFLIINSHGLNEMSIHSAFQNLCYDLEDLRFTVKGWWNIKKVKSLRQVYFTSSGHSSGEEVSVMLYLKEKLVKTDLLSSHTPPHSYYTSLEKIKNFTPTGVINADQEEADKELGKQLFKEAVKGYIELLAELTE